MRSPIPLLLSLIGFAACLLASPAMAQLDIPDDDSSAVILAYHNVGEDAWPDNSLRTGQFFAQVQELTDGGYNVMALPDIVKALKAGEKLPRRTIALTFEGAYRSAHANAIPMLLEKNIPFTVFYSSGQADSGDEQHMNWQELHQLASRPNVTLGILPASYTHLSEAPREEILAQINKARVRYREEFSAEPKFFSYPFGEYSLEFKKIVGEQNFDAAFGLQSGSISPDSDFVALPRFTMTEVYGSPDRFRLVANALPLPVTAVEPADPLLESDTPSIGFTVAGTLAPELKNLSCFVSGQAQPALEILGENRVELRLSEPISDDRTRVNCTMPGPATGDSDMPQSWRWFGLLLVNKTAADEPADISPAQDEPQ